MEVDVDKDVTLLLTKLSAVGGPSVFRRDDIVFTASASLSRKKKKRNLHQRFGETFDKLNDLDGSVVVFVNLVRNLRKRRRRETPSGNLVVGKHRRLKTVTLQSDTNLIQTVVTDQAAISTTAPPACLNIRRCVTIPDNRVCLSTGYWNKEASTIKAKGL